MIHGMSYPNFKKEVCQYLKTLNPTGASALDIGAGAGIYGELLSDHYFMYALEIFPPTYEYLKKSKHYRYVYLDDIRTFNFINGFDLIIMGDVLEHLSIEDAKKVIEKCSKYCTYLMVAIPYNYKQGAINGNVAEIHLQDDLTKENFNERYPGFELIFGNDLYGYYLKDLSNTCIF